MTVEATLDALAQADRSRSLDGTNLLLTHPRIKQVEPSHADINEIEVDMSVLRSDLVLLGHYHFHTRVAPRIWYAGSTDTFSFADDPDKAKGIVVLDTDSGECRHVPLTGQRPLVTLEPVFALGLSPAEVQEQVLERAAHVPDGAVARLYLEGVDPEAYRLLDRPAVQDASRAALLLKLEPVFATVSARVADLPELGTMPARWDRYVDGQDLAGYDKSWIRHRGREELARAVEEAVG
jgi:DNA repair exonuclease SbcCD nuclease subunit